MSHGDLREANIRLKRWLRVASEAGKVKNGGKPEVRYFQLWPYASRWRVFERLKWTLDGTADGPTVDTEACVCSAPTAAELLNKYACWAQDDNRVAYFKDRDLRGQSQKEPPPDPPEWAAQKQAMAEAVGRANENTAAWVKNSVRAQMEHIGMGDPVKFEVAWSKAKLLGLVRE